MVDVNAGVLVAISGAGVAKAFEDLYRPTTNDYRTTVNGICDFIKAQVNTGLNPSYSGIVSVNVSGINMDTVGGTGADYYRFSN